MPERPIASALQEARKALAVIDQVRADLTEYSETAAADIARYLRVASQGDIDLDPEAIQATTHRPYTLLPINPTEAHLIHWRGVRLPMFGWVVKQEPAFTVSRVSRSMDLLTPLPAWMKDEMGWQPPEHAALIAGDRATVQVTAGDEATFRQRYGAHLGRKTEAGFQIKGGGAWIKLVAALIRDGILPYTPTPVAPEDWNAKAKSQVRLRDYQTPFVQEFLDKGAVFFNLPPGGGKTFLTLHILSHLRAGLPVVIFAPSVILLEQWQERVADFAPNVEVTFLTYAAGHKALDRPWGLAIFDEAQTLPADTFSKLAFLDAKYRIGLSGSPWREDGRQFMITALCGFPCALRWSELIRAGVLKRPHVVVATVPDEAAKTRFTQELLAQRRGGRALIFCDFVKQGQALANALDVPFVYGDTRQKYQRVKEAPVCVVSRIADRGLDLDDLALVIEVAFLGGSREQEAQRLGRLLHSQVEGDHYLLFTPEEAQKFRPRIYGIEVELAGEVDIEFVTVDGKGKRRNAPGRAFGNSDSSRKAARPAQRSARPARAAAPRPAPAPAQPRDEIDEALALPGVAARLDTALTKPGVRRLAELQRVFRLCYAAELSPQEMAEGLGLSKRQGERLGASCRALAEVQLLRETNEGRYGVDQAEVKRLRALAQRLGRR